MNKSEMHTALRTVITAILAALMFVPVAEARTSKKNSPAQLRTRLHCAAAGTGSAEGGAHGRQSLDSGRRWQIFPRTTKRESSTIPS